MTYRSDYYVRWRDYKSIEKIASALRVEASLDHEWKFSLTDFIKKFLEPYLKRKGSFEIVLFNKKPRDAPAKVMYRPLVLWVDKEIWRHAELGHSFANYVLAHEIGHVMLHDHKAKLFSDNPDLKIKFGDQESSSEWQANVFADCFLVGETALSQIDGLEHLAKSCNVSKVIAGRRLANYQGDPEGNVFYSTDHYELSEKCAHCGSDGVDIAGSVQRCSACGSYMNANDIWQDPSCTIY